MPLTVVIQMVSVILQMELALILSNLTIQLVMIITSVLKMTYVKLVSVTEFPKSVKLSINVTKLVSAMQPLESALIPSLILEKSAMTVISAHTMMFVTMEFAKEKMSLVVVMEINVMQMVIVTVRLDNVTIQINLTILHALTVMLVLIMMSACQEFAMELQRHVVIPLHVKNLEFAINCQDLVNIQSKPMELDAQLTTVTFLNVGMVSVNSHQVSHVHSNQDVMTLASVILPLDNVPILVLQS